MRMEIRKKRKRHLSSALAWMMAGVLTINTALPVSAGETESAAELVQTEALAASAEPENAQSGETSAQAEDSAVQTEAPQTEAKPAQTEAPQTEPENAQTEAPQTEGQPEQSDPAQTEANPSHPDPAQTEAAPSQPGPVQTEENPAASETDPVETELSQTEANPSGTESESGEAGPNETEQSETESETKVQTESETESETETETEPESENGAASPGMNLITSWQWMDPEELLVYEEESEEHPARWALYLPGASEENPAFFEDVKELLPGAVLAELTAEETAETDASAVWSDGEDIFESTDAATADAQGSTAGQTQLALTDWKCAEYPEEGAWAGTYLFEAQLPEGYALGADVEALAVTVVPGGAEMLGFELGDLFGATLSVNGGEEQPMSFSTALDRAVKETAPTTITLYTQADIPAMLNITNGNNITITAKEGKNASISISEKQGDRPLINVLGGTITLKNIPVVSYANLPLFQLGGYQGYDGNPTVNIINTDISAVQTVFNCVKGNLNITGSTISSSASDVHTVQVTGGTATVTNSTLKSTGSSANTLQVTGGTANISGGSVEATGGSSCAVYLKNASLGVSGNAQLRASGSAGAVQVAGGKADINGSAKIECSGSGMGALTVTGGEVTLRDSASVSAANDYAVQLTGGSLSVSGNAGVTNTSQNSGGNKTHAVYITGGTATITGGKISAQDISHSCAVYISGSGSAEITGGSLDGKHDGVEMRGDKLRIGGNASITSSNNVALKVYSGTGAISIEGGTLKGKFLGVDLHNDSSSWKRTVTIQGGTISATTDGGGVGLYMSSSNGVVLKGGTYSYTRNRASIETTLGTLGAVLADGYAYFNGDTPIEGKLSAKTLSENPVTVKPCTHLHVGNWKADSSGGVKGTCLACNKEVSAVAEVSTGGTHSYYMRIEDAWAEAKKSSQAEVILLADAEVTDCLTVENGNNIKVTGNHRLWIQTNNRSIIDVNGGSLEIGEGTIEAKNASGIYQGSGSLKVSGGTVKGVHGIDIHGTGALTVTGGSIIGARRGVVMNGSCTVTVENGTITGGTDAALDGYSSGCFLDGRGTGSMTLTVRGGTISGLYGIRGETRNEGEPGSVTVSGGTVKGTKTSLLPLNSCRMQLTGGTFQQTGSGSSPNIDLQNSSANGKLRDVLADGYAFYAGNTPISGVLDQNSLSQTPVTVKKCTPHGWTWAQGVDGAWHRTCPYCGASETARVSVTAGSETMYYQEITDAWAAAKGKTATVTLLADIEISDGLSVMAGDAITLTSDVKPDGGTYTLKNTNSAALNVEGGGLTVQSIHIESGRTGISVTGGELTVSGGSVTGGISMNGGKLTMTDGSISGTPSGIYVVSGELMLRGGSITGNSYGIQVKGGEVTLGGSTVKGGSVGVYAQNGSVLMEKGEVNGSGNGGIEVAEEADVRITGGTVTGENSYGLWVRGGSLKLSGGTMNGGQNAVYMDEGAGTLKDILVPDYAFYKEEEKLAGHLDETSLTETSVEVKPCGDHIWGPWTRTEGTDDYTRTCTACGHTETMANVVASVTTADDDVTFYNDFAKAWAAAREAKKATVTLLADVTYDQFTAYYFETLGVDAGMEIKLVSGENAEGGACTLGGTVRKPFFQVSGSLVLEGVAIDLDYSFGMSSEAAMLVTGGSLTIRSKIKVRSDMKGCYVKNSGSVTVVSGGIYTDSSSGIYVRGAGASASVTGGEVVSGNSYGVQIDGGALTVTGGSFSGLSGGVNLGVGGTARLSGGTFRTTNSERFSIRIGSDNTKTLGDLLADGCAYYVSGENGSLITGKLGEKKLTEQSVTIRPCKHAWEAWEASADTPGKFQRRCQGCNTVETMDEVAAVTAGETVTPYDDIDEAWAAAKEAVTATVTLFTDIGLTSTLTVEGNENITLTSAEGKNYTVTGMADADSFQVKGSLALENVTISEKTGSDKIINMEGGSLTLKGAVVSGKKAVPISMSGGCLVMDSSTVSSENFIAISMSGDSSLTMNGGEVSSENYTAITLNGNSSLIMNGGKVSSESSYSNAILVTDGTLRIIGGTVTGNLNTIYVSDGSLIIDGGTLNSERHHAVYMEDGKFTMTGGSLNSNYFYGLQVRAGTVSVSGGTITGGDGGMHVQSGTVLVDGGNLTGSSSYGMLLDDPVTAVLTSGTFTGELASIRCSSNTALRTLLGEGYAYFTADETSSLITEGLDDYNLSVSPVTVKKCEEHIWGDPTEGSEGVFLHTCLGCGHEEEMTETDWVATVTADGVKRGYPTIEFAWAAAKKASSGSGAAVTVTLLTDVGLKSTLTVESDENITLTSAEGENYTVTSMADTDSFLVNGSLTLGNVTVNEEAGSDKIINMQSGSLTLKGAVVNGTSATPISVSGGCLVMDSGTVSTEVGIAIFMDGDSTLTMNSGEVSSKNRNAISLSGDSTLTMYGGKVSSENYTAIVLGGDSTLTMNSGEVSSKNWTAIVLSGNSTLTMNDGKVSSESANSNTIQVIGGTLQIIDGTVEGVRSAIYVYRGSLIIGGGTLTSESNSVVYMYDGALTMTDGSLISKGYMGLEVKSGTVSVSGGNFTGGIYGMKLSNNATAVLTGGTFTGGEGKASISSYASLRTLLGEGYAYFMADESSSLITEGLDDYNLSVSPVTVKRCENHVWGDPEDDGNGGLIHTCMGCGCVEAATAPVAEVTAGGSTKGYPTIELAWAAAKEAKTATVTLLTEVWSATAADPAPGDGTDPGSGQEPDPGTDPGAAAAVPLTVAAGETITLVSKANPEGGYYSLHGAGITVEAGGSLSLENVTVTNSAGTEAPAIDVLGGSLTAGSGSSVISMSGAENINAGAVLVKENGSLSIDGGELSGGLLLHNATAVLESGTVSSSCQEGMLLTGTSKMTVKGGTITGNIGSAVTLGDSSTLVVVDGQITGSSDSIRAMDSSSVEIQGGSFLANGTAAFRMTGGTARIQKGTFTANNTGCALSVEGGDAEITGGTFAGWTGSAVVSGNGSLKVSGGTFTVNVGSALSVEGGCAEVSGGVFKGRVYALNVGAEGNAVLSGGLYNTWGDCMIHCENGKTVKELLAEDYAIYWGDQVLIEYRIVSDETEVTELKDIFGVYSTVTVGPDTALQQEQISVDLTWGAMEFTYNDGVWDTETHRYVGGGWTCEDGADRITAVNTGTAPVRIGYSYTPDDQAVAGTFTAAEAQSAESTEARLSTQLTRLGARERLEQRLVLAGKPSQQGERFALGTVTVTIRPVQRAWLDLPKDWGSNPKIYAYLDDGPQYAVWPGVPMTKDQNSGFYYWEIPKGFEYCRVIFWSDDAHRYPADQVPGLEMNGSSMIYNGSTWEQYDK